MKNLKITFLGLLVLIIYTLNTNAQQVYVEGSTTSTQNTVDANVNYSGNSDVRAVRGYSVTADGYGYGGEFFGGWRGVVGTGQGGTYTGTAYGGEFIASGTAGDRYGVSGAAMGSGVNNYGVYGYANGTSTGNNFGVYGAAANSTGNNYAGFFNGRTRVVGGTMEISNDGIDGKGNLQIKNTSSSTFSRISMYGSELGPDNGDAYWDIAARVADAGGIVTDPVMNFWYHDGTSGTDILTVHGGSARVGVNTTIPNSLLHVEGKSDNTEYLIRSEANYVGFSDIRAFYGDSRPNVTGGYGYGVQAFGGYRGGWFFADGETSSFSVYGVYGSATSSGTTATGSRYGGYFTTSGTTSGSEYSVYAVGDAFNSGGSWTTSDRNLKESIKPVESGLDLVKKLNPTTYTYKQEGKLEQMNLPTEMQYGFVAQELEKVVPELVKDIDFEYNIGNNDRTDNYTETIKGVRYDGLIPILTSAIQEQQDIIETQENKIESQESKIESLESQNEQMEQRLAAIEAMLASPNADKGSVNVETIEAAPTNAAKLGQNNPNPFYHKTVINYNIPETAKNVTLQLTTTDGKVVKQYDIDARGLGNTTINGNELPAGTYLYSLVIDGQVSQTKQMVLTK